MFSGEPFVAASAAVMPSLTSVTCGVCQARREDANQDGQFVMALSIKDEDGNIDLGAIAESEFQTCFSLPSPSVSMGPWEGARACPSCTWPPWRLIAGLHVSSCGFAALLKGVWALLRGRSGTFTDYQKTSHVCPPPLHAEPIPNSPF